MEQIQETMPPQLEVGQNEIIVFDEIIIDNTRSPVTFTVPPGLDLDISTMVNEVSDPVPVHSLETAAATRVGPDGFELPSTGNPYVDTGILFAFIVGLYFMKKLIDKKFS